MLFKGFWLRIRPTFVLYEHECRNCKHMHIIQGEQSDFSILSLNDLLFLKIKL